MKTPVEEELNNNDVLLLFLQAKNCNATKVKAEKESG